MLLRSIIPRLGEANEAPRDLYCDNLAQSGHRAVCVASSVISYRPACISAAADEVSQRTPPPSLSRLFRLLSTEAP
jgi:hypothetical protein